MDSIRNELIRDAGIQAHICQSELVVWKGKQGVVKQGRNDDETNTDDGVKKNTFDSQPGGGKSGKVHNSSSHHHCGSLTMKHENINEGHLSDGGGNTPSSPNISVVMGEAQRKRTHHEMMEKSSGDDDMLPHEVHWSPWKESKQQQLQQKTEEVVESLNLNKQVS